MGQGLNHAIKITDFSKKAATGAGYKIFLKKMS